MATLDIGLIGCGRVAQSVHLPVLTKLPGVRLVALADPDPQRLEEAHHRAPGAVAVADYQALLEMAAVKAVVICAPNDLHGRTAVDALDRGKHVYLEKPLATTLDEAERVLAALERAGVVGMIGFNYRYNRLYQALKRCLWSADLGEWVGARTVLAAPESALPAWKQFRGSGGGALLDMASHHFDLIRFLFEEEICEVSARLRSRRSEGDTAVVDVRLDGGLMVQSFFSINTVDEDRFEVYTERAKVSVDRYRSLGVEVATAAPGPIAGLRGFGPLLRSLGGSLYLLEKYRAPAHEPSFRTALAEFVKVVREERLGKPDFQDGYVSLAVVLAAEESARDGRVVRPALR
ncbi:MAG TPA: Gfo/Idh/MocA family oxidoreductase [Gemmatimonadota bacterium]|nr:Gfo/Idh/MocA family oxidoreductase [Gemmatimonadota bacterium]